jgi:HSP20 family protein
MSLNKYIYNDLLLNDLFDNSYSIKRYNKNSQIKIDLHENDNSFILSADLPGYSKDNININIENNILTLIAEAKEETSKKTETYYYMERNSGKQTRTVKLPDNINTDNMSAKYMNGVLYITMSKKNQNKIKNLKIE